MARIVGIEKGASGAVKAVAVDGSFFIFRNVFLAAALMERGLSLPFTERRDDDDPFVEVADEALDDAVAATEAEARALALLARAEQYRFGLERKLTARGFSRFAIRVALDGLESVGLLSDERYASSWIRQRIRHKVEGPRSLAAALSVKGVDRRAVKAAMDQVLEDGDTQRIIMRCAARLVDSGGEMADHRARLIELGWRPADVDEAIDSLES
ncbi:MAG TPA: regulatory protein RecX [Spirochaetales bacterium]|nr:regulatory protein RecX [Spirochaetales bacterium]HPG86586.1 regulatory protein RecX [Spirochaetales bacterium]